MNPNDPRMENLRRAAAVTDLQRQAIQAQLRQMPDDMVMSMINENDDLREMLTIDANNDNGGIVVNYANQPQNQAISFQPPWEGNLSSVPTTPQQGFFQNNVFNGYWMDRNDPRVKAYTPGMRLYGINPMAFFTAASTSHQYCTMCGFARRHMLTSGCSSSSVRPISKAPIALRAPTDPP